MSRKVVLGFSGGLDTSYCVKYLGEDKGYEGHSIIVNKKKKFETHGMHTNCKNSHHH